MKVRELIASLGRVARRNSPPETDGGGEQNTDNDPEIVWLTAGPAQDAVLWPTRVFPAL
jgi:hypothetical protein